MNNPPSRLLLIDDHEAVCLGVQWMLQDLPSFEWVGRLTRGDDALAQCRALGADIVVLDVRLPGVPAAEVLHALRTGLESPPAVVVYTASSHRQCVLEFLRLGADAYILKGESMEPLRCALEAVRAGERYHDPGVAEAVREFERERVLLSEALTVREKDVLRLIAASATSKEIAAALGIAEHTVEAHRRRLMDKTRSRNLAGLTRCAVEMGLTEDGAG